MQLNGFIKLKFYCWFKHIQTSNKSHSFDHAKISKSCHHATPEKNPNYTTYYLIKFFLHCEIDSLVFLKKLKVEVVYIVYCQLASTYNFVWCFTVGVRWDLKVRINLLTKAVGHDPGQPPKSPGNFRGLT